MARSLKVAAQYIGKVKTSLIRNGYSTQADLVDELGISPNTLTSFLNGRPIFISNFKNICEKLALDWQEIADRQSYLAEPAGEEDIPPFFTLEGGGEPIYLERPILESRCRELLLQPVSLVRIKAPWKMGKTCLITKVLSQLRQQGYRTVHLDLDLAGREDFSDLSCFLRWFCVSISQELDLQHRIKEYQERPSFSKLDVSNCFTKHLLDESSVTVLCLDRIDRVFRYPEIASDFLGLLRAWHEKAKNPNIWRQLRLVVIYSEEPNIRLRLHESPFNVGTLIPLEEFTPQEIEHLAQQYGLSLHPNQLEQFIDMVGGHPYLVEQALSHLRAVPTTTLEDLLQLATTEMGIYRDHLWAHRSAIENNPPLMDSLKQLVAESHPIRLELTQAQKLDSMGLVQWSGTKVTLRCQLYRLYFRDCFGVSG